MKYDKTYSEISVERPRKYPAGLPVRLGVRCRACSRACTIDLRLPDGFPSVYVERLGDVFSTLCAKLGAVPVPENGQLKVSSDANKE